MCCAKISTALFPVPVGNSEKNEQAKSGDTVKKIRELSYVYFVGAALYCCFEVAIRGFTHWTMALAGGLAFSLLYQYNLRARTQSVALRGLVGSGIVTGLEFAVGCVVNRAFGWHIWDYSARGGHVLGQICPMFSIVWFLLSLPVIPLSLFLKTTLFADGSRPVKRLKVRWFYTPPFRRASVTFHTRRKKADVYSSNYNTFSSE